MSGIIKSVAEDEGVLKIHEKKSDLGIERFRVIQYNLALNETALKQSKTIKTF